MENKAIIDILKGLDSTKKAANDVKAGKSGSLNEVFNYMKDIVNNLEDVKSQMSAKDKKKIMPFLKELKAKASKLDINANINNK